MSADYGYVNRNHFCGWSPDVTWDDLRFPAQGINPPGQVSDPDIEGATGFSLFDSNSTETLGGAAQLPHSWREGTALIPHVHWTKTSSASGDVLWQLDYEIKNPGETFAGTYANQLQVSSTVGGTPDGDTEWEHLISSFGEIEVPDCLISCVMLWKVSRVGGDAADTYGADARLLEYDIHYQIDDLGSKQQFTKD